MKNIANKMWHLLWPLGFIILTGYFSHFNDFPFMNYSLIINKKTFIFFTVINILILSFYRYKLYSFLSLDDYYLFNLHILLIIVWLFLFFFYQIYFLSLFIIIFNLIIFLIIFWHFFHYKMLHTGLLFIYLFWLFYVLIVNFFILI